MGLNKELLGDMISALKYHKKALEVWKTLNENLFMILSLRHIITISE
jgi:hypothetical protein